MYLNIFPQSPTTDPASPRRSCVSAPPASLCAQTALTPTLLSLCYWSLAVNLVSGLRHSRPQPAAAACLSTCAQSQLTVVTHLSSVLINCCLLEDWESWEGGVKTRSSSGTCRSGSLIHEITQQVCDSRNCKEKIIHLLPLTF